MPIGTVKYVGVDGRFGFISRDDKQPKVFVHVDDVMVIGQPFLEKGQRFSFDVQVTDKGPRAFNLTLL